MTIHRMPITKGRVHLGELARRAHNNKEYFILEKDGIPVIGILSADELEDYLELNNPQINEQIQKSNEDIRSGKTKSALDFIVGLENHKISKKIKKSA